MFKLAIIVSLSACATGRTLTLDRDHTPHAGVRLDLVASNDTTAIFPTAIDPALPSVEKIDREVRVELGNLAKLSLALCVSPDGHVISARPLGASRYPAFDAAVAQDVAAWKFERLPGPATVKACRTAMITYRSR